jgi:hypothetical protein
VLHATRILLTVSVLALLSGSAAGAPRPLRAAPELTGGTRWLNVPDGRGLTLAALRNKVVLIEFWTGG